MIKYAKSKTSDGFFVSPGHGGEWEFISVDASSINDYSIAVKDLINTQRDW